ncbi:MAG: phospho-N-acetylmuramoyl-pentapeptide-transferase [Candidatus Aminicenantes bacterium]|nr:phospho-N-acetylmuramoyl-pentapeptide-transferase [Candidatus Aminicenantes bacterium]
MIFWINDLLTALSLDNLVSYITFRALMAVLSSFLFGIIFGKKLINIIYQLNFRDKSREYGDISSENKSGTPTMGGLIIFLSFLFSLLIWGKFDNFFLTVIIFASFWFTAIGFVDDYLKSINGSSDAGMSRGLKLLFQVLFGIILSILVLSPESSPFPDELLTKLFVPFFKNPVIDLSWFYYVFIVLVIIGISNSINFADGLDGLATIPVVFLSVVYAIFAYIIGNARIAAYLWYPYIEGSGELVIVLAALIGALAAFLWFNTFPAQIFMGDTGSLFLGGVIATSAILLKKEIIFLLAGGVFVVEFLTVFIQDYIGIKLFKRRIFYRAPIHHTFQFLGVAESKIVVRFWIIAAIFTLVSLISLKLR